MGYTFTPKEKFAKASGTNMRISAKSSALLCRAIRRKKLTVVKRLLGDLAAERRSLGGKYYTKTAREMLALLESCEKNADFLGLDSGRLFVHASAHHGTHMRRRRRKAAFGSALKSTNLEIMLVERGFSERIPKSKTSEKDAETKQMEKEMKKEIREIKEQAMETREKTEAKKEDLQMRRQAK